MNTKVHSENPLRSRVRRWTAGGVAVAVVAMVWLTLLLTGEPTPVLESSDGSRAILVEAFVGNFRDPKFSLWERWLARSPQWIRRVLPAGPAGFSGTSRSWTHVPDYAQSLDVWTKRINVSKKNPPQLHANPVLIMDDEGWAWANYGLARSQPSGTVLTDYVGYNFAGFPRWKPFLDLHFVHSSWRTGKYQMDSLGVMRIRNPAFGQPPHLWATRAIPQTANFGSVEVILEGFEYRQSSRSGAPAELGDTIPEVRLRLSTRERQTDRVLTNAWEEVSRSFFDNYGNCSHNGLPPARSGSTNTPPIQWRIHVDLVGDYQSQVASNYFLSLPSRKLPATGERVEVPQVLQAGQVQFWVAGWFGAGHVVYTNGVVQTNFVPGLLPESLEDSTSTSVSTAGTQTVHTAEVRITSPASHLCIGYDSPVQKMWASVRAVSSETKETRWLHHRQYSPTPAKVWPIPERLNAIWFTCEGLDTNQTWQLTVGVHRPHTVEFLVDRPVWQEPGP